MERITHRTQQTVCFQWIFFYFFLTYWRGWEKMDFPQLSQTHTQGLSCRHEAAGTQLEFWDRD